MGSHLAFATSVALGALGWFNAANALDYAIQQSPEYSVVATGEVVPGERLRFENFLARQRRAPSTLYLSSPGGRLTDGIQLGAYLRQKGFATRVGPESYCASACVFIFIGGVIREVDPSARVGVHMASLADADWYIQELKEILITPNSLDAKIRHIVELNEQEGAMGAQMQTAHIVKMGVSLRLMDPITDNRDIHWLTPRELRDYNVVNTE